MGFDKGGRGNRGGRGRDKRDDFGGESSGGFGGGGGDFGGGGGFNAGGFGGGIEADTADVTLVRSRLTGNAASIGAGVGAIRVTLDASTIDANVAATVGGGIWADQVASLTNSTVTGNEAGSSGGGIALVNTSVQLVYATVAQRVWWAWRELTPDSAAAPRG